MSAACVVPSLQLLLEAPVNHHVMHIIVSGESDKPVERTSAARCTISLRFSEDTLCAISAANFRLCIINTSSSFRLCTTNL